MFRLDKLNDNELVQRFIQGDHESLEILIVRHKSRIYSYILLIVKNQDLAEDIFQDTFIKVIRSLKRGKYVENGKFVSWVLRIAHNLIIDHFRKEKLQGTISNDSSDVDIFNSQKFSEETIEDQMVYSQILNEVKHLVKELPEDQQQVIYMRHYMGLSFKEIAEQTDVSINTALGRMRYALINLRKLVDEKKLNLTSF
ncbi:RNA polymerase sigma factor [Draconibacterium halophilum]|uniref:Sigma-70 family RNA polymerase sigma factor n=1 Tax=Draconibacterium halophilum TaxID=2706887 RepID=A0A6C0RDI4_9BACT|nr:sigma-70 family RNA polymerase sigma factor [Draconibacterium halophilum]QIA08584.1 sigma-70 family RNA polymerase sigma factor [Draconibacterium halophilum]